jgi:deoxycytidine triphosphate deaminase
VHKRHAITIHVYDTNNESMMNIHKQKEKQIKMDSYDVHVHPIQFQLYDKEYL